MRRFSRRRHRQKLNGRGVFALCLLTVLVLFGLAEWRIHSVFEEVTYNYACQMITDAVNEAVSEVSEESTEPLYTTSQDTDGALQSLSINAAAMNQVKSRTALAVQDAMSGNHCETGIPLGTLLGSAMLHGRGPSLPLRVSADGNVQVDYESTFSSAGVNQTCHRIVLTVTVQAFTYVPGASGRVEQTTSAVLSETVIVGQVPDLVTGWTGISN